jgi:hypothetical protein
MQNATEIAQIINAAPPRAIPIIASMGKSVGIVEPLPKVSNFNLQTHPTSSRPQLCTHAVSPDTKQEDPGGEVEQSTFGSSC